MKSHEEIEARLAQYKNHSICISPATGKEITEKLLKHWDEIKTFIIGYRKLTEKALVHKFYRKEFPDDPKGEAYIKYLDSNYYILRQEDFNFRMGYVSFYGSYSSKPLSIIFELDYYHSGDHQFGVTSRLSGVKNHINQLQLSSMNHSQDELIALGNQLQRILGISGFILLYGGFKFNNFKSYLYFIP